VFDASHPFLLFDYFRVPYRTDGSSSLANIPAEHRLRQCGELRSVPASGRRSGSLHWPLGPDLARLELGSTGIYYLDGIPLCGHFVPDRVAADWLAAAGGSWAPTIPVHDAAGRRHASVWHEEHGSVFLPFDPGEVITNFWSEGYKAVGASGLSRTMKRLAVAAYYRARPAIPRPVQIRLRRVLSHLQARSRFPRWPVETALHDLYDVLFRLVAGLADEPIPWISTWPNGHSWTLVLTHDVESQLGHDNLDLLRDLEIAAGYRSSWNFVPRRYRVDEDVIRRLTAGGFEVGVHGLYHDGRDLASLAILEERLPAMREYAERWGASGFRSPATRRVWEYMPLLGFDYDTSYPDTDPFEPDAGGCCSWLPYFNGDLVELPITLPQDHTLLVILDKEDEQPWLEKALFLKERGGMALLITHPDYMLESSRKGAYARFLERFASDPDVWRALPREVSAWWRRRAASRLERIRGEWTIVGPAAADGGLTYVQPGNSARPATTVK
jgi:hypothetical protein